MTKKRTLRVAEPGDQPATPKTVSEAVEQGSSRDVLASMRRTLAAKLDDDAVSSNSLASVSKELRELDRLIRLADAEREAEEAAERDEVAARRSFNPAAV